jgi:extracellular factor (EF) 3-hydroxypalmitic acid methyl ester biosynthesis protein
LHATLLKLTRFQATFEVYGPAGALRTSEVLSDVRILIQGKAVYSGRAVVSHLMNLGSVLVCEATLDEAGLEIALASSMTDSATLQAGFEAFIQEWGKSFKVYPEFKVIVADMQTFLRDLQLWLERVELEIRAAPSGDRLEAEQNAVREIGEAMVPAFNAMHERLEDISGRIEEELRPVHQNFSKRQLHPLLLCSPFAYRTYQKPLGYAGDYEMVNMITRDPYEGGSLFAKVVNLWFLSQWPARAHRNRITYLKARLKEETLRGERLHRPLRVLNLGCGPAREIQEFLAEEPLSSLVQFVLLDFNEETIQHTAGNLDEIKRRFGRQTTIQLQRKSVHQVLKEGAKPIVQTVDKKFDLIYCAGLFDYLPDRTCKQLMTIFYEQLAPAGLLIGTNVNDIKPFRHMLEFILDWHLIYRDSKRAATLLPDCAPADAGRVTMDDTTVNLFMEVRRPDHA